MNIYDQKIVTGPVVWDIKPVAIKDSFDYDGFCSIPMEHEISINSEISGERVIDVLLHECLHAMEHMYDIDLSEEVVGKLGNMLGKLFVENPWMIQYINEQIQISQKPTTDA